MVNDADGLLVNTWRAMSHDPDAVAKWADWPAAESDLHARHAWLVGQRDDITRNLEGDPDWFDAKAAGWWLWGIGLWIGSGWCSGDGPWRVADGQLLHAGNDGRGIHRQLLHAGDDGRGIHRQLLHAGDDGQVIADLFAPLAERLRHALITCGDWTRVVTPSVMFGGRGDCAVFLDPPYPHDEHSGAVYAKDHKDVADDVMEWALANGDDPCLRIALCGYEGRWEMPGWTEVPWRTKGGYASRGDARANVGRERVWFSPHCLRAGLWDAA